MIIEKKNLIYLIYIIFILSITIFLSVKVLTREVKLTSQFREIVKPNSEYQLLHILRVFEETKKICAPETRNSLHFKDYEWKIEKSPNTFRIITLGDSMTMGSCVATNSTWPKQLERKLNELGSHLRFEVFNMGNPVPHTGTFDEVEVFKNLGLRYNPDMVILQYFHGDWQSVSFREYAKELWEKYKNGEYKLPPALDEEIKKLNASEEVISGIISQIAFEQYDRMIDWENEWEENVKKPLVELIQITQEKNIKLIVITWDTEYYKEEIDKLTSLLQSYKIPFYDFSEYLHFISPSVIRLPDGHLTASGYEIVANKIMEIIVRG